MLRKKKNLLGRQSGAQDVQGEVSLDNPNVVIDRMTGLKKELQVPRPPRRLGMTPELVLLRADS